MKSIAISVFVACIVAAWLVLLPQRLEAQAATAHDSPAAPATIDWPSPNVETGFSAELYIRAAVELQALGKDKASSALKARAAGENDFDDLDVDILCRMLFVKKPGGAFRRPRIGGAFFPDHTTYRDWLLEPITISEGVPFFVSMGCVLGGVSQSQGSYLDYCMKNCNWSTYRYAPKTKAQLAQALHDLLDSPKLKGRLTDWEQQFFAKQIRPLPDSVPQ